MKFKHLLFGYLEDRSRTQKEEFSSILNSNDGDINILFKTLEKFSKN